MGKSLFGIRRSLTPYVRGSPGRSSRARQGSFSSSGLTLIELIIALVILAVALLALAGGLTTNMLGVRREANRTIANQVAVTIIEGWRERIGADTSTIRIYDAGEVDTEDVTINGVVYTGSYTIVPKIVDAAGARLAVPLGADPHIFEIQIDITPPNQTASRTYSSIIVRNP